MVIEKRHVSYSQYSMWNACRRQYKLNYIDRLGEGGSNIYSLFGVSFHETIQTYLATMFESTQKAADEINLKDLLMARMVANFTDIVEKEQVKPCTKEEFADIYKEGCAILDWFSKRKNRIKFYAKRGWKLIGIELPLEVDLGRNIMFKAFLDIVLKDKVTGKIKIIDLKTSTKGWNKFAKSDTVKANQIRLYKKFYSDVYKVDPSMIDVEFHIAKRRLNPEVEFDIHRFQRFTPSHGKVSMNRATKDFDLFLNSVFDESGEYMPEESFPKTPKNKWTCEFCDFSPKKLNLCEGVQFE